MRTALVVLGSLLIASTAAAQAPNWQPPACKYGLEPGMGPLRCADPNDPNSYLNRQSERAAPAQADAPTGVIPAIHATVIGLRFFESPAQPTTRNYDDLFFYNAARYIYWELRLVHPDPGQGTSFTIEEIWHSPGGDVAYEGTRTFAIEPGWTSSTFWASARLVGTKTVETQNPLYYDCLNRRKRELERGGLPESCSPTTGVDIPLWQRGAYQVDIMVDHQRVATG